ncbi:MAG: protein-glutamine gamma-glutamyltransferase [Solirubrobacteraceae bacterium]|nr:protein-glutamine gamma-glutamyltransferase [Solirubrobacteraceae bacterium]
MNGPRSIPAAAALAPRRTASARSDQPLLPAPVARLVAFAALAGFGAVQWGRLLEPTAGGAMVAALLAGLAAGGTLTAVARARPRPRLRRAAAVAAAAVLVLLSLVAAGVPAALLDPRGWGELAGGLGQGLSAVPSVSVPYGGAERWTRTVLVLGGCLLIGAAALLAFAPRRDGRFGYSAAAAVALGTLYAAPVIQRSAERPFLSGAVFAFLLALFLWLERVERRNSVLAAIIVALAVIAGLVVAPRLDAERALLDYEGLAQSLGPATSTQYSWNHSYGPLDWPRDGREVLRVRAPRRAYWKAVNLTAFDGVHWLQNPQQTGGAIDTETPHREWLQKIHVTVRALESTQFVAAGTTLRVTNPQRAAVRNVPGVLETAGRPLQRGQAYTADVYVPRPTTRELELAGTGYPAWLHADYGFLRVPSARPGGVVDDQLVVLPFWGTPAPPGGRRLAAATFAASPYAGVYALARRLRKGARTPYAYMTAIERFLTRDFSYSETPPSSRTPLADFLLRDRVGYCQQFSGAMALLLRMGGVPARVSAGFAPGVLDDRRKEYVVRDIDAHSWVEVYFPGIGWVTRDPTPSASPARSQTADLAAAGQESSVRIGGAGERALGGSTDRARASSPAVAGDGGGSSTGVLWIVAGLLALAAGLALLVRRRRRCATGPEDELAELRRALHRSGREPQPDLTLELLARRFAGTAAEGYLRTLAGARYGYEPGSPTREQRAALRRELGAGLGLRGRLRAWWALPPRPRGPMRARST